MNHGGGRNCGSLAPLAPILYRPRCFPRCPPSPCPLSQCNKPCCQRVFLPPPSFRFRVEGVPGAPPRAPRHIVDENRRRAADARAQQQGGAAVALACAVASPVPSTEAPLALAAAATSSASALAPFASPSRSPAALAVATASRTPSPTHRLHRSRSRSQSRSPARSPVAASPPPGLTPPRGSSLAPVSSPPPQPAASLETPARAPASPSRTPPPLAVLFAATTGMAAAEAAASTGDALQAGPDGLRARPPSPKRFLRPASAQPSAHPRGGPLAIADLRAVESPAPPRGGPPAYPLVANPRAVEEFGHRALAFPGIFEPSPAAVISPLLVAALPCPAQSPTATTAAQPPSPGAAATPAGAAAAEGDDAELQAMVAAALRGEGGRARWALGAPALDAARALRNAVAAVSPAITPAHAVAAPGRSSTPATASAGARPQSAAATLGGTVGGAGAGSSTQGASSSCSRRWRRLKPPTQSELLIEALTASAAAIPLPSGLSQASTPETVFAWHGNWLPWTQWPASMRNVCSRAAGAPKSRLISD